MVTDMKESGKIKNFAGEERCIIRTEISTMVSGIIIKNMELVYLLIKLVKY